MKQKEILQIKCEQLAGNTNKANDNAFIGQAVKEIKELEGASGVDGKQFLNDGNVRGYYLAITMGSGDVKNLIAFVFTTINRGVLEFMTWAAKKDTINGILGFTEHVVIVKEYKLRGGPMPSGPSKEK